VPVPGLSFFNKNKKSELSEVYYKDPNSSEDIYVVPGTHPSDWNERRETHYGKFLGSLDEQVLHDRTNTIPHIDIYRTSSETARSNGYSALITSGMSDISQFLPAKLKDKKKEYGKIEIMWYVKNPEKWMYDIMLPIAKTPYISKSFYWYGHTLENAFNSSCNTVFTDVVLSPNMRDPAFNQELVLDGIPVVILAMVPITRKEMQFIMKQGFSNFLDLALAQNREDEEFLLYDGHRKPLV
jgi:hypothetical protein